MTVCDEQTVLRTPRHGLAGDRHVDPYVAVTARQDCLLVELPRRILSSEAQKGNPTRELSSSKVLLYGT